MRITIVTALVLSAVVWNSAGCATDDIPSDELALYDASLEGEYEGSTSSSTGGVELPSSEDSCICEQGPPGPQGPPGEDGEKGEKGDKGDPGDNGTDGVNGADGAKGDKGDPGRDGVNGLNGADGAKGDKGDRGEKGEKGDQGIKGDKGDPGEDGADGTLDVLTYQVTVNGSNTSQSSVSISALCEPGDRILTGGCFSFGPADTAEAVYLLTNAPQSEGLNGQTCVWHKPTSWAFGFAARVICIDLTD